MSKTKISANIESAVYDKVRRIAEEKKLSNTDILTTALIYYFSFEETTRTINNVDENVKSSVHRLGEQMLDLRMQLVSLQKLNEEEIKRQIQFAIEEIKSDTQVAKQAIYEELKADNENTIERIKKISSRTYELIVDATLRGQQANAVPKEAVRNTGTPRDRGAFGGNGVLSVSDNK